MEEKKLKLAIVSGGFDPLHIGHLELFERAKSLADDLFVIVNTDDFLIKKKGKPFMPLEERMYIIQALKPVKFTIKSIDTDDTVCESLKFVYENYKVTKKYNKLFF
jgi:cytidyltransferase-like protein